METWTHSAECLAIPPFCPACLEGGEGPGDLTHPTHGLSRPSAALRFCSKKDVKEAAVEVRGMPASSNQLQKPSHFSQPGWVAEVTPGRVKERAPLSPKALASPATSDRGIEQGGGAVHCALFQGAASSPFVYHTSCLPFCLLHTSSPSLIVSPCSPFGPLDFRLTMGNSNYLRHKKK